MCFHCSLQVYRLCGLIIVIGAMAVIAESSLGMTKLAGRCRGRQVAQNYIVPVSLARNNDIVWGQAWGLCSESVLTEHFHHTTLRLDPHNVPDLFKPYPYVRYIDGDT